MDRASSWLTRAILSLALAYIMLRPVSNGVILYPILAVIAIVSAAMLFIGRRRAAPEVVAVLAIALFAGLYGAMIGLHNPGVSQQVVVWVAGPIIYGLWALSADVRMIRAVMTTTAWATITLSLLILVYIAGQTTGRPWLPTWLVDGSGAGFNMEDGATAIRFYGLSTLTAAAPMWIVGAFVRNHRLLPRRWVRIAAAVTATAAAVLGGRNAIVLVLVAVPLLLVLGRYLQHHRPRRVNPLAFLGGLAVAVVAVFQVPTILNNAVTQRTWNNLIGYFQGGGDQIERVQQSAHLIDGWLSSPVLGHGLGAIIQGYWRSGTRPWNFELQYHMMLFQFGIIGGLILIAMVGFAILAVVKAHRARPDMDPVLMVSGAAALGMLIANATNPYLQAPGHMWAVWIPLLVANAILCTRATASDAGAIHGAAIPASRAATP